MQKFLTFILLIAAFLTTSTNAGEMRRYNPIRTPVLVASLLPEIPPGAEFVKEIMPIDRQIASKAVKDFAEAWNTPNMLNLLDSDFFDKSLLNNAMASKTKVPSDARLRLLSIQGIHTLQQVIASDPVYDRILHSIVLVTAKTQIEFNDAGEGFVRLPGTNDFLLQVKEKLE